VNGKQSVTATIERRLPLQGSCNFRDIGGYETADGRTVRWKRLYRSDALHGLTPDDLALIAPLGVATLIDLRSHREFEASGHSPVIAAHGTVHRHLPFLPESTAPTNYDQFPPLTELYVQMIEKGAATIRAVFETLADNTTYPAVVHCAVGKDRTGVTIALLLRTLGVSDEVIVADYALTDGFLAEGIARLRAMGAAADLDRIPEHVLRAHAETMAGFLAAVDTKFGGTDQLLADTGLLPGTQSQIRELLLERL
jgi:protein tyrosine/serine phosphatase